MIKHIRIRKQNNIGNKRAIRKLNTKADQNIYVIQSKSIKNIMANQNKKNKQQQKNESTI